jgi:hypothetical protein
MLHEVARLVRSKNAGPFWLTFDIMFDDPDLYRQVRDSGVLSEQRVRELYPKQSERLQYFECDAASAIKFSFPREHASGSPFDSDVFGGQQYAALLDLEVALE